MKKIFKVFGVLIAFSTLLCLTGCDLAGLFGEGDKTPEEIAKKYQKADGEAINHEFYLSDDKSSYIYYTSIQRFAYGNHNDCIYQISFTPKKSDAIEGTWKLYSRERAGKTIELIYDGTFKGVNGGSVRNGGTVDIFIGNEKIDTLTIEERAVNLSSGTAVKKACYVNVAASHKAIGAHDQK